MNTVFYLCTVAVTGAGLAVLMWRCPRTLRLPGLSRIVLGLGITPFVLAGVMLAVTTAWPLAPRILLLTAPGILTVALALYRRTETLRLLRAAVRRWRRRTLPAPESVLAVVVLLAAIVFHLAGNARQPVSAHDALIYLNEARAFALTPRWDTYLSMVNPSAPDALVSGHTHTWLYPSFLAHALLAAEGAAVGAGHDLIARAAIQGNLLLLILAVMGLAWAVTRRHAALTIAAGAAAVSIPYVGYVTANSSIDAFRILTLVLLGTVLIGGLRRVSSWVLAAVCLGFGSAAHTLNLGLAPLVVGARLVSELSASQWDAFRRIFLPVALICLLPVAAFYGCLWMKTGRPLGHGLHYPHYAGSSLEAASRRGILDEAKPTATEVVQTLQANYGGWVPVVSWLALAGHFLVRPSPERRFLAAILAGCWLVLLSGCIPGFPSGVTRVFLGNARYALAFWFLAIPLVAAVFHAIPTARLFLPAPARRLLAVLLITGVIVGAWQSMALLWPIRHSTTDELQVGEWRVAKEVAEALRPAEAWMTDRNTAAYYVMRPGIFLYTPAGKAWIQASTAEEAWELLCRHRVRIVALGNLSASWWPGTPFHQALHQPGHTEILTLPRWQIYRLNLPEPSGAPRTP